MIGTEKQIAFAAKCMEAAAARFVDVDRTGRQQNALQILRLVDAGNLPEAEALMDNAAGWWELCITDAPAVDAGRVIDTLKKYL
jgi:hypothetical protein